MADRLVKLYFFPTSYYSQRVLVVLKEKGVKYEETLVDILNGEQNEPWYIRQNPSAQVPALQDGEKLVKESQDIMDYVDREFPSDSKLVPDLSTEIGKEVSRWRKTLDEVPVFLITYGVFSYPELSASGLKTPKRLQKSKTEILASFQIRGKKMEQLADEHPDLREAYMSKVANYQKYGSTLANKENVTKALDDLEGLMDKVEEQLKKVEADPSKELWFCGQQFTAADIILCVLLGRLDFMGLGERYHSTDKRPCLHSYWQQAQKRPSVQRYVVHAVRNLMRRKIVKGVKAALPIVGGLVTVGLAAGLAFAFAQRRS